MFILLACSSCSCSVVEAITLVEVPTGQAVALGCRKLLLALGRPFSPLFKNGHSLAYEWVWLESECMSLQLTNPTLVL